MTAGNEPSVDFDPFAQGEIARTAPLAPQQRELWSAIQLGGDAANCAYNEVVGVRMRGALDRQALLRALAALVARHDALRSVIAADGSALIVNAQGALVPAEHDFRSEAAPEAAFAALAAREASTPFDLAAGPLGRARLARLGDDDHALLLVFHHIVCDGWSFGVLLGELAALYSAEHTGTPVKLAAAPSYADYADTARAEARSPDAQRALSFWLSQYEGALPVLDLPTDRPRPALRGYRAGRIDRALGSELVVELRGLAKQHGASLHQLLLTGFQTLLARLTGQWDVVVGLPTAGQAHHGQLGLVGHAVNYLPLRAQLSPQHALREALAQTKRLMNAALAHQDVSFGTLLENLPIPRDPSRIPLAPVCFNLETAAPDQGFSDLDARIVSIPRTYEAFELFANLVDRKQSVMIELQYNADLFDAETVSGWIESYEVLLRALVVGQQQVLSKLPVLSREARAQLDAFNETSAPFERDAPLASFVERAVDATPDATAMVFGDQRLSYRALDARVNKLAHLLRQRGVRPDDIVGVCVRRSIDTLVAQLAVLKAGGAYLPLDPENPSERLRHMLEDANAKLVVTRGDSVQSLGEVRCETLLLDERASEIEAQPATRPAPVTHGQHLAYVIYTSGSTGKPKGVLVTHRNFANFLAAMDDALPLTPAGTWLFATSVGFDISLLEIFGALSRGFTVVIHGEGKGTDLASLIASESVTHFQCTPSQARIQLASAEGRAGIARLDTLVLGGEALASDLAQSLLDLLGGGRLFNGYGPTETTIYSTMYEVKRVDGPIPIGRPVANTRAYVLDQNGELAPRGSIGELYIGGAGVTRGYHGLPELTAERFLRDPFAREAGARMYRTGDLVRQRASGELEYHGRNDHQVKLRGYRIELGEIEVALRAHKEVREAVVIAREDRADDKRLVAYLVCDQAPAATALRAHLTAAGLPDYMLPAAFVALPKLPTTASGKVDRRALPAPEGEPSLRGTEQVAPRTETEAKLASIWQEVLGVGSVSIHDGFFALGGHSLLAVKLISGVRNALGVDLPLVDVFRHPRLSDLAAAIDATRGGSSDGWAFPPPSTRREAPLSYAQERLWFIDQLGGQSALHNLALTLRIDGMLDPALLGEALMQVIVKQEALRTRTFATRGVPSLAVQPAAPIALEQHDASRLSEAELAEQLRAFATVPFDLDAGPWLRVALFTLAGERQVLCAVAHHATWDGTSLGLFQRELGDAYEALRNGNAAPLPQAAARYVDYTVWERGRVEAGDYDAQIAFWKQKLAQPPTLDFPADKPRALVRSQRGATERLPLDRDALAGLEAVARGEHATPYMALVALLDVLALRFTGQQDVVIASPVNGRVRDELAGLVGMFVNTVLMRVDVAPELTFRALLRRVREAALEAYSHAEVPFDRVVHAVDPPRDTSRTALFQLMFSYLERTDDAARFGSLPAAHINVDVHEAATDLFFYIPDHGTDVAAYLEYASDLFEPETARRLLRTFARLIAFAAQNPDACIADFPVVDDADLPRVITPVTELPVSTPPRIDAMLSAQAARTPDATALVFRDRTLSYAELEAASNRLAHVLVQRGARRDGFVGVCMRRSESLIVALLAVVKAGAAYLPLDPTYPDERLRYMVDDSGANLVIAEQDTAPLLRGSATSILLWDELSPHLASQPATPPALEASERDLMYIIYTSGSTGKPKGVMVEHRQVVNMLAGVRAVQTLDPPGVWLSGTSVSFDISVVEVFGTLTHGFTLVLLGGGTPARAGVPALPEQAPYDIASLLKQHQVTHYQCTPSQALLLLGDPAACAALSSVREMVLGGEALTVDLAHKLQKHVGGKLINGYGPTENTVWSTFWPVPDAPAHISLGAPLANTQLRILDARMKPVPVGVDGELYVAGRNVTRGYLNRAALTDERFVADPFGPPGARMYKTGDLVRVRNDGTLSYMGRNDFQVKLRGFRIELGEIEDALRSLAHAREAVVIAREQAQGDARLIAYLVPSDTTPTDTVALRNALRTTLPDYMVPAAFVTLDALPLNGSGKVDRARLPQPVESAPRDASAQPTSELEQKLVACWQSVLKAGHVGLDDNFFDLGGHSLLMGRLADEISTALARKVSIPELFQFPSVRALARHLDAPASSSASAGQQRATERRAATRNVQGRRG